MTEKPGLGRLAGFLRLLLKYLLGQGLTQIIGAVVGFLVVRWLTKDQLAQSDFALQMQTLASTLADLGMTGALVGLIGEKANDPVFVGRYTKAIYWLRWRIFWISTVVLLVSFPILTYKYPWSIWQKLGLFVSIFLVVMSRGWSIYNSVLIIHHRMKELYVPNIISISGRGVVSFLLHITGTLNGVLASCVSSLGMVYQSYAIMRLGKPLVVEPDVVDKETVREVIRYVVPMLPGLLFSLFQGQIALFFMSLNGNSHGLADLAAMGKIGQIYVLLSAFLPVILEPMIARQPARRMPILYFAVLLGALVVNTVLIFGIWLARDIVIALLSDGYKNMRGEVVWAMLNFGIYFMNATVWTLNIARRWVFPWSIWLNIAVSIAITIYFARTTDLSHVHQLYILGLFGHCATFLITVSSGIWGMLYYPNGRQVGKPASSEQAADGLA